MRTLKKVVPPILVLAAVAVTVATLLSDHTSDYGTVPLPPGGAVQLPKGTATVFIEEPGSEPGASALSERLVFAVRPAGGGAPLEKKPTGKEGNAAIQTSRSQELGAGGSIAKVEVPAAGTYMVSGRFGDARGLQAAVPVELSFGDGPFSALARKWKTLALLLGAAILVWLVPMPRPRQTHWQDELAQQSTG